MPMSCEGGFLSCWRRSDEIERVAQTFRRRASHAEERNRRTTAIKSGGRLALMSIQNTMAPVRVGIDDPRAQVIMAIPT